ncbi:MAG: alpha/beta fold hydrolase [Ferruginibacter sp.]
MKQYLSLLILVIFFNLAGFAATDSSYIETSITLHTPTGDIFGTLTTPATLSVMPVALLIAGSGPTDRNGNNFLIKGKNNNLMQMAYALANDGIASLRFDKRGVGKSYPAMKKQTDMRFENYVDDVSQWIDLLKKDTRFNKIIVIGHSEGSLIGMIAGKHADKYISISGPGQSADVLMREQLSAQSEELKKSTSPILDSLKAGKMVPVDPSLSMYFDASIQPYLISWFKYDPQVEIKKLKIPILILQGTNDLQVKEKEATILAKANPAAKLLLIENMNHVMKLVVGDREANVKAYSDPSLLVSPVLLKAIVDFIKAK